MKTFKFKLYNHPRNRHLIYQIELASEIYNHCIALHKRYYKIFGKYLSANKLKVHLTKLKKLDKYAHWWHLNSQAIQDIVERIDRAYKLFFRNLKVGVRAAPPSFKKRKKYKSFTLKQTGYRLLLGNKLRIGERTFKYFKSREIEGNIKTVTIKRDSLSDIYVYIVTDAITENEIKLRLDKGVGFDFGLKTFLTASDGRDIKSPLFFKQSAKQIKRANQELSKKKSKSNNCEKARLNLAQVHQKIANQRNDFHWKLANQLTDEYDYLFFEDLNLKGMQRLWGKKINDLGFYSFLQKVKYYAEQKGKKVHFIDRFYPSSKTCSNCGYVYQELKLRQRSWICQKCDTAHNRDRNASVNIYKVGASTFGLEGVRLPSGSNLCLTPESPLL